MVPEAVLNRRVKVPFAIAQQERDSAKNVFRWADTECWNLGGSTHVHHISMTMRMPFLNVYMQLSGVRKFGSNVLKNTSETVKTSGGRPYLPINIYHRIKIFQGIPSELIRGNQASRYRVSCKRRVSENSNTEILI
jgi:hypothetical protein